MGPVKTFLLFPLLVGTAVAQNALPVVNEKAPELSLKQGLQTPGGQTPSLASLHGRIVVLEFWATWCGGCVAAIPHLNDTAEQVKSQPITFLSVTDEDQAVVKAFLQKRPMNPWVGVDQDGATFARYGILGRPQTLIIDRDGVLRAATQPEQINTALLENALEGKFPAPEASTHGAVPVPMDYVKGVPPPLLQVLIRPAAPAGISGELPGRVKEAPGGRVEYYGIALATLLYYANDYNLRSDRLIAPSWFQTDRYDASVAVPAGKGDLRTKLLLQAVTDTFSLRMHREQRPAEVFVLTLTGTSGLKPSSAKPSLGFTPHPGMFSGVSTPVKGLGYVVQRELDDVEVIDETGLPGNYDFDLSGKKGDASSLANALHDQLGLTLRKQTRDREFLVVDEASQPQTW